MEATCHHAARRSALLERFPEQLSIAKRVIGYREAGGDAGDAASPALPLVLLHGIGSGSASWVDQLAHLGSSRRVLAWDAPGYGRSADVLPEHPVANDYAQVLSDWLGAMKIGRCVLVGHSLGAIMAASFVASQGAAAPDRVAGLLLLSPAGGYGKATEDVRAARRDARLAMIDTLGPAGMATVRSANMVSAQADEAAREWVRRTMTKVHVHGYRQATHLLARASLASDLSRIAAIGLPSGKGTIPIGVIAGAADAVTPPDACESIARTAGVALRVVPAVGHAGYVEAPIVFSELIADFCDRCK